MPLLSRLGKPTLHYRIDDFTDPWTNAGVIVLQHGYARSSRLWYGWIPHIARRYKILRVDLRGHGESPVDFDPSVSHTLDAYVEDIVAVLDHLKLVDVHYCGESFGGIVGMALAAEYAQRVRSLTLVASPVYQNKNAAYAAGYATREQSLRALGTKAWARAIYGAPGFFPTGTPPELRDWYVDEIGKSDVEVLCGLYVLLKNANATALLSRIEAPVFGLYPTAGSLTSSEQEALLTANIRNLRMIHLPTQSHAILTLEPYACARHLLSFVTALDSNTEI
jgi:3-oxoadipate enol-lactonase